MMTPSRQRRILVQLDLRQTAGRHAISGVLRYAATHPDWDLQILGGHPANEPICDFLDWHPAGLITDQPTDAAEIAKFRVHGLKALASFHRERERDLGIRIFHAECDQRDVARAAADLLTRKGLVHFAYVPAPIDDDELNERERAFCRTLLRKGFDVNVYNTHSAVTHRWANEISALSDWLAALPKPCGVMAVFDQRAKHVIDACRLSGIAVPEQVQVIGVDNEEFICEQTMPSLSSVLPDFEGLGYRAAEQLDKVLRRPTARTVTLKAKVKGVVERLSTADSRGAARCVALAREFIRQHAATSISVADIIRSSHTSERLLQRHFRAICGKSVRDELIESRLNLVKEHLRSTRIPIKHIGDFCGFPSTKHLMDLFKRRFGLTMSAYREKQGICSEYR